jgi:hypothetical protein
MATAHFAADAPIGATAEIATFDATLGADCIVGAAPALEIVQQGGLGVASVGASSRTIEEDGADCDGVIVPQATLSYEGAAGGIDTVVVREITGMARPDVIHTGRIRVR